jgi:hypothetical protein
MDKGRGHLCLCSKGEDSFCQSRYVSRAGRGSSEGITGHIRRGENNFVYSIEKLLLLIILKNSTLVSRFHLLLPKREKLPIYFHLFP